MSGTFGTRTYAFDTSLNPTTLRSATGLSNNADNQRTGPLSFVYDHQGNPTTYKGASTLEYDAESRLVHYGTFTAGYNGDGLRAWMRIGTGGKRFFLYDGTDLLCEFDAMGMPFATNTWGANGLIGRREGSTDVYFAYDPMGNVANTIDKFGVVTNVGFDAYGTRYGDTAYATVGYGGQWGYYTDYDAADKLILCTHRCYDPQTGIRMGKRP